MTAVRPPGRFGVLSLEGSRVVRFEEKPQIEQRYINGGFFVLSPKVLERIASDGLGAGTARIAGGGRRTRGVPPSRFLAADGHIARARLP
jgi:hypothetical protein